MFYDRFCLPDVNAYRKHDRRIIIIQCLNVYRLVSLCIITTHNTQRLGMCIYVYVLSCLIAYHIVLYLGRVLKKTKQIITEWALCDTQNSYTRTLASVLYAYNYATTRSYVNIIIISTVFPKTICANLGFNSITFVERYVFRIRQVLTGFGVARNDVDGMFAKRKGIFKKSINKFVLKAFLTHTIISWFFELHA